MAGLGGRKNKGKENSSAPMAIFYFLNSMKDKKKKGPKDGK